jgi:hypothetical protein
MESAVWGTVRVSKRTLKTGASMNSETTIAIFRPLPADATNGEALIWIERLRRVLMRWEELPPDQTQSMTREIAEEALFELDEMERMVCRDMEASMEA